MSREFTSILPKPLWLLLGVSLLVGCSGTANKAAQHTESNARALAEASFNYGQYAQAESQYLKLLASAPDNLNYQLMLGRSQYHQDKKETAMAKLRHVTLAEDPIAADAAVYLGRYLLAAGRTAESVAVYQLGLPKARQNSVKAQLHNGLGVALLETNLEKARQELQQAITLAPDSPYFRSNLALSYLHDGQIKTAREVFTPLLAYRELPIQVELNFALLLLAENQQDQARALLSRHMPASEVERDLATLRARLNAIQVAK
ncbi:TPA: tetratricopeptide repeat protein [Vibrio cholerae]|nr:tetratricopeptide repeat protein [Vibrio cholerae]